MIDFLVLTTNDLPVLRTIYYIKVILNIALIITPIILIIISAIELSKLIFSPNETSKTVPKIINKIICAVVIFFIPLLVNFVMSMISQNSTDKVELWSSANDTTIKKLTILKEKEQEAMARKLALEEKEKSNKKLVNIIDDINSLVDELGNNLSESEKDEINKMIENAKVSSSSILSDEKRNESLTLINKLKNYSQINIASELDSIEQILNNKGEESSRDTIEDAMDDINISIMQFDDAPKTLSDDFNKLKNNLNLSSISTNKINDSIKKLTEKKEELNKKIKKIQYEKEKEEQSKKPSGTISSSSSNSTKDQIVEYAKSFVGVTPYVYGGTSLTTGVDCSGFVMKVYEKFGYNIPRGTTEQAQIGTKVSLSELQKGDLVFSNSYNHVTMYIGNGQVVQAQCTACGPVKITNVPSNAIDAVRIIN